MRANGRAVDRHDESKDAGRSAGDVPRRPGYAPGMTHSSARTAGDPPADPGPGALPALPEASAADTARVLALAVGPIVAQGVIARRRRVVALAGRRVGSAPTAGWTGPTTRTRRSSPSAPGPRTARAASSSC
ncbi:hypothetical protein PSD17_36780 [Pseudonocardia sp. D17]|nr:hypothetical protein PSD17_36780 [Pseudonocardia sp. D17]